jgi:hypothetical protein
VLILYYLELDLIILQMMTQRQIAVKGYKYNTPQIFMVVGVIGKRSPSIPLPPQMVRVIDNMFLDDHCV